MIQNVPPELQTSINRQVLKHVEGLSAHSDIVEALGAALEPLGDIQVFCPDCQQYRYVVASTKGIIIALAVGMNTIKDEGQQVKAEIFSSARFERLEAEGRAEFAAPIEELRRVLSGMK